MPPTDMLAFMKKELGMTIIELLFALSVAGILVSLAVPSFVGSMRNSEMVASTNVMVAALHTARSEAVKNRGRVTLCRADISSDTPTCSTTGDALIVFTNDANDVSFNPSDTEVLIRAEQWLEDDMTINTSGVPAYVSFTSEGITQNTAGASISGRMTICGPAGLEQARVITLSPTGRPQVQKHADVNGAPGCS